MSDPDALSHPEPSPELLAAYEALEKVAGIAEGHGRVMHWRLRDKDAELCHASNMLRDALVNIRAIKDRGPVHGEAE